MIGVVVLAVLVVGSGVTYALSRGGDDKVPASSDTPTAGTSETPSGTPSPTPGQAPSVDELVTASKLYAAGPLSPTQCAEPTVIPSTFTTARLYYNAILPCMNRTWLLAMKKAGLPYRNPKVILFAGPVTTACGPQNGSRAFYCDQNESIYLPYVLGAAYYKRNPVSGRVWMMNTFAHEYGHHVQKLAGIYAASVTRETEADTPNQKAAESRRRNLQAACLGSAYLGSAGPYIPIRGPLLATWRVLIANTGDESSRPRMHDRGSRVSHNYWSLKGFNSKSPNVCNTYLAAPDLVD